MLKRQACCKAWFYLFLSQTFHSPNLNPPVIRTDKPLSLDGVDKSSLIHFLNVLFLIIATISSLFFEEWGSIGDIIMDDLRRSNSKEEKRGPKPISCCINDNCYCFWWSQSEISMIDWLWGQVEFIHTSWQKNEMDFVQGFLSKVRVNFCLEMTSIDLCKHH